MFLEIFALPSPGLAILTCWVLSSRCVCVCGAGGVRGGIPSPRARWLDGVAGAGAGGGGSRRGGPQGPRRGAAGRGAILRGGGAGETPAGGCGKTILMERQRPDRPAGALRERGNEIRLRKGRRKVSRERNYHHNGGKNVSRGKGGENPILLAFSVCLCDMVRGKKGP